MTRRGSFLRGRAFLPLTLVLGLASAARAQISDTSPPSVVAISFTPTTVNVTAGPAEVIVTATVTDNLSGTAGVFVLFRSPSGTQEAPAGSQVLSRISGDAFNGVYRGIVAVPQFAEAGVWKLNVAPLYDVVGNLVLLAPSKLQGLGFATDLTVTSVPDTQPPQLTGLTISPTTLNVSSGPQMLTADFTITDNVAGADFSTDYGGLLEYTSVAAPAQQHFASNFDFQLVSGTVTNGVWRVSITFPQFAAAGTWSISSLDLFDRVGNSRSLSAADIRALGLNPDFTVISPNADVTVPSLTGLTFSPTVIDTSAASQTVTVTLNLTDDKSGISVEPGFFKGLIFWSPSNGQFRASSTPVLAAGTLLNGTWTATVDFPRFSEAGTWRITSVFFNDAVNNFAGPETPQLVAAGLPTELVVFKPSGNVDGTVGAGGGTVTDDAFETRASLTIPGGVVPAGTTVAIDVLSNPGLPTPKGFTVGTLFTSFSFSPTPAMPLKSPGITVVLPFSTFKSPGSLVRLYRLDSTSGLLVPAVTVAGVNAVGMVSSDGLSARFTGVARFSTLVGFFPTAVVGDLDGDGDVNCADLLIVRAAFGKRSGQTGYDPRADVNSNGVVDVNDLGVVSRQIPAGMACIVN